MCLSLILFSSNVFANNNNDCSSIKGSMETVSFSGLNGYFNINNFFVSKEVIINDEKARC
jgi:hypothetical protein